AILRPPHALIHVLTDRPAFAPHDRCHELRQDDRVEFDLSELQLVSEGTLQCGLRNVGTTTIADVLADYVLGKTVRDEWLDECALVVRRDEARHPALRGFFCFRLPHRATCRESVDRRAQLRPARPVVRTSILS